MGHIFTSESVTEGHPDKLADLISDKILDEYLKQDTYSRCAVETSAGKGFVHVFGEVTSKGTVDVQQVVKDVFAEVGYTKENLNIDSLTVLNDITTQSPDISAGVSKSLEQREGSSDKYDTLGAGDQGIVFGYAEDGPNLMPLPIFLSHRIAEKLTEARKGGVVEGLRPDGKVMVSVEYSDNMKPVRVDNVLVSNQHDPDVNVTLLSEQVWDNIVVPVLSKYNIEFQNASFLFNPSGRFVLGGPASDGGLTGRKIVVDSYGSAARVGGGAYSGKDATKVDRSAAYMARYVAKNLVAAGLLSKCEIQISYAIGKAKPVSVWLETFETERFDIKTIKKVIDKVFDLRPAAIIEKLGLRAPIFSKTTNYGHYGRNGFSWEQTDSVNEILDVLAELGEPIQKRLF